MAKAPKFGLIVELASKSFVARVIRRRTSGGTTIDREQTGEREQTGDREQTGSVDRAGAAWGDAALPDYLAVRKTKNANTARRKREAWREKLTFQVLARIADQCATHLLKYRADLLWQEMAFWALKRGESETVAITPADSVVGKTGTQRLTQAASSDLDHMRDGVADMAVANAMWLAKPATSGAAA